jgi:hypothetical protein
MLSWSKEAATKPPVESGESQLANQKNMLVWGSSAIGKRDVVRPESPVPINADFHGWLLDQASALRGQRSDSIDWQNLAEELEAMAASERRTRKKQLKQLMLHLLKMRGQAEQLHRLGSRRRSIRDAREEIEDIIADSPGILQGKTDELLSQVYERARIAASEETKLPLKEFPEQCPWSFEDIMRQDFFPGSSRSN